MLADEGAGDFPLPVNGVLPTVAGAGDFVVLTGDGRGFATTPDLLGPLAFAVDPAGLGTGLVNGLGAGGAGRAFWEGAKAAGDQVLDFSRAPGLAIGLVPAVMFVLNPSGFLSVWARDPGAFV